MDKKAFYDALRGSSLYPRGVPQAAIPALDAVLDHGEILPIPHLAYCLATAYHEVGANLTPKTESLNYTTAARIKAVWPTRFKTAKAAEPYVRQPKKLANFVYNGRMGNRVGTDDGWNFRGRGLAQITGRSLYDRLGKLIGRDLVNNPDLLLQPDVSAMALIVGMKDGVYTGKRLADYTLPSQYAAARAIVNADGSRKEGGVTIGEKIAGYARAFEAALRAAVKAPAPAPVPAPTITADDIRYVQERLHELGYTEVGRPDGIIGKQTKTAVLAFRNENGMAVNDQITKHLIEVLATAPKRQLQPERVAATPADVRERVPEVKANWRTKIVSAVVGIPSAALAVGDGVVSNLGSASGYIQPVKDTLGDVPGWVWFLAIGITAFIIWKVSAKGEEHGVEAWRKGERR